MGSRFVVAEWCSASLVFEAFSRSFRDHRSVRATAPRPTRPGHNIRVDNVEPRHQKSQKPVRGRPQTDEIQDHSEIFSPPCGIWRSSRNPCPGGHQRTQKKGPDCALMIGTVSFQYASFIAGTIAWIVRCQCAKSNRSHELFFHEPEDVLCTIAWDEVIAQGVGVELIGPEGGVVALRSVDDVVQLAAMFVPEPLRLDGDSTCRYRSGP